MIYNKVNTLLAAKTSFIVSASRYMDGRETTTCVLLLLVSAFIVFLLRRTLKNKLPLAMYVISDIASFVLFFTALMGVFHIAYDCKGGDPGDFETSLFVIAALTFAEIGNALLTLSCFSENIPEFLSGAGLLSFCIAQSVYVICLLPKIYLINSGYSLPIILSVFILLAIAVVLSHIRSEKKNATVLFIMLAYLAITAFSSIQSVNMVIFAHQIQFAIGLGLLVMLIPLVLLILKNLFFRNSARWLITVSYFFYCLGQFITVYSLSRAD